MQIEQLFDTHRMTIVPLAICFFFGWLAGWFGRWLWVDITNREKHQKGTSSK